MPGLSRKKRVALLLAGLAAFVLLAHRAYLSLSSRNMEVAPPAALASGMVVPGDLALETPEGKKVTLSEYRGKVVLINFWAGWCGPCLHEMPGLFDLQKRLSGKGFTVLAVNMDEELRSGMMALKKSAGNPPFPIFRGAGSQLADRFGIEGLPYSVLLGKNFKIAFAHAGEIDWSASGQRALVEGLL
jgi:thiol-disulfide isomerase/thioredoxin